MPVLQGHPLNRIYHYGLLTFSLLRLSAAGTSEPATSSTGYTYGQSVPVTCLNRTIDSGEHITDNLGKLQYIPFPTCNETSLPLTLHYGIPETLNCTIAALPDDLYHLLEYYVHSDVPMTCRVPSAPLANQQIGDDDNGPAYTPITFAVQGTLQLSHLHLWTDLNVLVHSIGDSSQGERKKKSGEGDGGYVVAGTAYSVPEFDGVGNGKGGKAGDGDGEGVVEAAREPWTAGHGTKVVRGEPLTFSLSVRWVEGGRGIGWPALRGEVEEGKRGGGGGWFSRVVFFGLAASVGALGALYWERSGRGRGGRDGILGVPVRGKGGVVGFGNGNGGRVNGYGGYAGAGGSAGENQPFYPPITSPLRRPHPILIQHRRQRPQRRRQIHPLHRLDRHLPTQCRTQLQVGPAHRGPHVLGFCGGSDIAGDGEVVIMEGAVAGRAFVSGGSGAAGGVQVECVEDLVESSRPLPLTPSIIRAAIGKMSSITIATLPRISRDALSALLLSTSSPSKLAVIDVRDSDHVGGHILTSTWVPSSSLDYRLPELIRTLQDKEKVVFHCALSQQRGPSAALRYARERERVLGQEESKKQEVFVLEGGFVQWQEKYGKDVRLTEAYVEDIWREY
ncbi:hypothetical protein ASPCADRAFT_144983 [Aspergillus carbonarius ITEM 5010]|uniref:Rhodanese domain-containing protein n=1 Tax=Aspergillus carbonarius (strain ITEM 5010) TaxID=602072 RepID=A0A1R3RPT3_ASPC5|nr:hypothetical protein ASPCADRAFT_144983 [Aspergillus carbonarius ITEM 5010]